MEVLSDFRIPLPGCRICRHKLFACKKLVELPRDMGRMVSLRNLELDQCTGLTHMPCGLGQLTSLQTLTKFVVGKDCSSSKISGGLSELKSLDNLKGELTISKLEDLKNASFESKEANLKAKQHLGALRLDWRIEPDNGKIVREDEVLLEGLQPNQNLKELHIYGFRGARFPGYMMSDISSSLPHLLEVTIWRCYRCKHLPSFSQLPMLKVLNLEEVTAAEYIEKNMVNEGARGEGLAIFFPSLKELRLFDLPNLKGWWKEVGTSSNEKQLLLPSFPCLSKLTIAHCPKLTYMPLHPYIEELELKNVNEKLVQGSIMMRPAATEEENTKMTSKILSSPSSPSSLSILKSLHIDSVRDLLSLPEEGLWSLTCLERLSIEACPGLLSLPGEGLKGFVSLRFLSLSGCKRLMSLSQELQHLTALEELEIRECREFDFSDGEESGMQLQGLKSLRSLKLDHIPKLESLPDGLQHVTTLQDLCITSCSGFKKLPKWTCKLILLRRLEVSDCPKFTSVSQAKHGHTTL